MPIFEYRCSECAHLEEVLQKHTDPAPATCPACGKAGTMAKELSMTSFQLKGGGWYKDLYGSSKPAASTSTDKPEAKAEKKGEGGGSSGSSGSSSTPTAGGSSTGGSGGGSSSAAPAAA
jgi:putative FmdB family regulatory protein